MYSSTSHRFHRFRFVKKNGSGNASLKASRFALDSLQFIMPAISLIVTNWRRLICVIGVLHGSRTSICLIDFARDSAKNDSDCYFSGFSAVLITWADGSIIA